ncbi:MAG: MgtC/SapB family protein [Acidobacteriota bacterium]|nr:MAG: MgtC/SapB family protein [Acidobacteriota bacterium]
MSQLPEGIGLFRLFGEALAIGLLIGSERYKRKTKSEHEAAGVRTFAVISLLGGACAVMDSLPLTALTFSSLTIFLALAYYRDTATSEAYGLTTEMAALLTFWLAYLLKDFEPLAISTAIVLVILLAAKEKLHHFVRETVSQEEFFGTLKFLAVIFVVFPLLPNRYVGPVEFFNPTQVWMLVILISAISYAGYILIRVFGSRKGLLISSVLGGVVSTTAVTISLAERSREMPEISRVCGLAGIMANSVQFPRLLFLIWVVDASLGKFLLLPFLGMFLVGSVGGWLVGRMRHVGERIRPIQPLLKNPFSLGPILKIGVFFVGVFTFSKWANVWFGESGIYLVSALSGLGSVSAVGLSLADMVGKESISIPVAAVAILIALTSNALLKWIVAAVNGSRKLAFWLGAGFVAMLGVGTPLIIKTFFTG